MLSDFSYDFNKGDRIGIVGRNGVGKVSRSAHVVKLLSKLCSSRL
jgi:ABC-type polysaccharide/polyol phosphate transport system ATPase subunit